MKVRRSVLEEIRKVSAAGGGEVGKKTIKFLYRHLGARLMLNSAKDVVRLECFGMKFFWFKKTSRRLMEDAHAKMSHVPVPPKVRPPAGHQA